MTAVAAIFDFVLLKPPSGGQPPPPFGDLHCRVFGGLLGGSGHDLFDVFFVKNVLGAPGRAHGPQLHCNHCTSATALQ